MSVRAAALESEKSSFRDFLAFRALGLRQFRCFSVFDFSTSLFAPFASQLLAHKYVSHFMFLGLFDLFCFSAC